MSRTQSSCALFLSYLIYLGALDSSPSEVMVGGSRFPAKEAVILGVPAPSKLLRVKLMVLNYVKMWKQGFECTLRPQTYYVEFY
jgi:hypothetical protein